MITRRVLRSAKQRREEGVSPSSVPPCFRFVESTDTDTSSSIRIIPKGSALPHLDSKELAILRAKQSKLSKTFRDVEAELPPDNNGVATALSSTLIFAQYEAGTAVCIDSKGVILTCSHCFGESEAEWQQSRRKWMLYYTGHAVLVECRKWDAIRDLALAQVIAIELDRSEIPGSSEGNLLQKLVFSAIAVSDTQPKAITPIVCIGQPGRDDLESKNSQKTTYNLVEISEGRYRGLVPDVDPHDCSNIGTLKHDAWTYWGHSGAPLIRLSDGSLIGVHSSWDDQTTMRHGVPWIAIREFLNQI